MRSPLSVWDQAVPAVLSFYIGYLVNQGMNHKNSLHGAVKASQPFEAQWDVQISFDFTSLACVLLFYL